MATVTFRSLYSLPADCFHHIIAIAEGDALHIVDDSSRTVEPVATDKANVLSDEDVYLCTACREPFDTADALRQHSHSAQHIANIRGTETSNSADDCSDSDSESASGSEASDDAHDTHSAATSPRLTIYTSTRTVRLWKALVIRPTKQLAHEPFSVRASHYVNAVRSLPQLRTTVVLLCMGGRFSGAVYIDGRVAQHKSFQRYTVRAKQGGTQSTHDSANSSRAPKSIGATIRRKEAVRFAEMITAVLTEWYDTLRTAQCIFIFAPSYNAKLFYTHAVAPNGTARAGQQVNLDSNDLRIRAVPLVVKRPTFAEVEWIYKQLTAFELQAEAQTQDVESIMAKHSREDQEQTGADGLATVNGDDLLSTLPAVKSVDEAETVDLLLSAIADDDLLRVQTLIDSHYVRPIPRSGGLIAILPLVFYAVTCTPPRIHMLPYLSRVNNINEPSLDPSLPDGLSTCWTALHRACYDGADETITALLDCGADPAARDTRNRTPFACIRPGDTGKTTRQTVRVYAGVHLDQHNWTECGVQPFVAADEEIKKAAAKEKAKAKKKAANARAKERKAVEIAEAAAAAEAAAQDEAKRQAEARTQAAANAAAAEMEAAWRARSSAVASMSDRERRAMAAERRVAAAAGTSAKCSFCSKPLLRQPFERLTYKYCSIECLNKHRGVMEQSSRS